MGRAPLRDSRPPRRSASPTINTDVWEKSGLDPAKPPTTWQELDDALAQIKAAKDAGTHSAWPTAMEGSGSGTDAGAPQLQSLVLPGRRLAADGRTATPATTRQPASRRSNGRTHLFQTYCSEADRASKGDDYRERFGQGLFAYYNNDELGVSCKLMAEGDVPDLKFGVAEHAPDEQAVDARRRRLLRHLGAERAAGRGLAWVDFLTRDGNLEYNQGFGFIPPRISVQAEYLKTAHPIVKKSIDLTFKAADIEKHPRLWDMWAILDPGVQGALGKKQAPEEAARSIAAKVNKDVLKIG